MGVFAHPLLEIAPRLVPSGAIASVAAKPGTSRTYSAAEAADEGAAAIIFGSSTLGLGLLHVLSFSRLRGIHRHRLPGSLAH
jgi:hypothetical protein